MDERNRRRNPISLRVRQLLQMVYRRRIWGMDIHPSAAIAPTAYIDRTWPRGIHIGAGTIIDEEAVVLTHDMTRGIYLDTNIGCDCFVGPRAIILPGVSVGDGTVVTAGSVVTKSLPPNTRACGNPAKIDGSI